MPDSSVAEVLRGWHTKDLGQLRARAHFVGYRRLIALIEAERETKQ